MTTIAHLRELVRRWQTAAATADAADQPACALVYLLCAAELQYVLTATEEAQHAHTLEFVLELADSDQEDDVLCEDGIDLHMTCTAAPLQYEGTVDGVPAYFRERHEEWQFTIGPKPIFPDDDPANRSWFGEGSLSPEEAKAIMRNCIAEYRSDKQQEEARRNG